MNPLLSEQGGLAAVPPSSQASDDDRKGSPLLVFLTVLLVLVGIADAILWGIVACYFLRCADKEEPPQAAAVSGELTDSGAVDNGAEAGGAAPDDGEEPPESEPLADSVEGGSDKESLDPVAAYIRDMGDILSRHREAEDLFSGNFHYDTPVSDIAELMGQVTPVIRQVVEDAEKVTSDDPEIRGLHQEFRESVRNQLEACEMIDSEIKNDHPEPEELSHAGDIFGQGAMMDIRTVYMAELAAMAQERGIDFPFSLDFT